MKSLTEPPLGGSREAVLVLLAVLVGSMLLERRSLGGRLEILEADFALDALRSDVLCVNVSLLSKLFAFCLRNRGQAAAK
jgi:hypothetical protein